MSKAQVTGFVVRCEEDNNGKKSWRKVSRRFHVRAAAEQFRELAERQAQAEGRSTKFYVLDDIGRDGI